MHPLVQQNTVSEIQLMVEIQASSPSQSQKQLKMLAMNVNVKRQLLHRIKRISSSSKPSLCLSLINILVALTTRPGHKHASRHMHVRGHVFSPMLPGCKQQNPPK
mmetsp:Transcript_11156/g.22060  ORF Transcript_11156/g.22060 Transcript_11156/m.22060 type:complete len:105 (+) Transcript_11156:154-468(+)